jgi:hypothetical protein
MRKIPWFFAVLEAIVIILAAGLLWGLSHKHVSISTAAIALVILAVGPAIAYCFVLPQNLRLSLISRHLMLCWIALCSLPSLSGLLSNDLGWGIFATGIGIMGIVKAIAPPRSFSSLGIGLMLLGLGLSHIGPSWLLGPFLVLGIVTLIYGIKRDEEFRRG